VATASAAASGNTLQAFTLSGSAIDDDGTIARYEWDFEDDGTFDWSSTTTAATAHLYPVEGTYRAKLRVLDDKGGVSRDAVTFYVHAAYYVTMTGSDANPGTPAQPFGTIPHAMARSAANGLIPVNVALGTYSGALTFQDGITVTGGFDPSTWVRASDARSLVTGTTESRAVGLVTLSLMGLEFVSASVAYGNSIAMLVEACGSGVQFVECAFTAGAAANGLDGTDGVPPIGGGGGYAGGGGGDGGVWTAACATEVLPVPGAPEVVRAVGPAAPPGWAGRCPARPGPRVGVVRTGLPLFRAAPCPDSSGYRTRDSTAMAGRMAAEEAVAEEGARASLATREVTAARAETARWVHPGALGCPAGTATGSERTAPTVVAAGAAEAVREEQAAGATRRT
jgi:PKD repeat protein